MDFYKDSCCGARQLPQQQVPSSSADRGHSLSSLHLPPAALASLPIGFGMALAMNQTAMNAYSATTEQQKQDILNRAHNVRSEREMHDLVASLSKGTM